MFKDIFKKKIKKEIPITEFSDLYKGLRIVVSFSLYGNVEKYINGLSKNCKIINDEYPDFWIYVYIGNDVDKNKFIENKFNIFKNLVFIETGKSGHEVMSHRFFAIDRPEVGVAFSRDLDSYINFRDKYCINQFIKSDKHFQIIRDNRYHGTEILGGMWGIKKGLLNFKITDKFNNFIKTNKYNILHGFDQFFLRDEIYPFIKLSLLVFDEYFNYPGETPQKIIAPVVYFPDTNGYDFVGRPVTDWNEKFEIRNCNN